MRWKQQTAFPCSHERRADRHQRLPFAREG